ncbi:MAG: DUF3386 family protein [Gemmataceae bacterium]
MKHWLAMPWLLLAWAATAHGHFIWIVPDAPQKTAEVYFSEGLEPDAPALLDKIAHTTLILRTAEGKDVPLRSAKGAACLRLELPGTGPRCVGGICQYGVIQRGPGEPFLLNYYPKAILGSAQAKPWGRVPLEIVPFRDGELCCFQVLWRDQPLAEAEVTILGPDGAKLDKQETNQNGIFPLGSDQPGLYGLRVGHVENKEGMANGQAYRQVRHYATLVFALAEAKGAAAKPTEDPAASKLLADARAARAQWTDFPGFTADMAVNLNGQVQKGKVQVEAAGKVKIDGLDAENEAWAKRTLGSTVAHRIDNSARLETPCAFADEVVDHPLGRKITVLNDELHSSYRIRDQQITEVNRVMGHIKFTISVIENKRNPEGKYLSVSYMVNYWDVKTGQLHKSEAHFQSWQRVGSYDLPAVNRVITASSEKEGTPALDARSLTLSNFKLSGGAE